ncbi:MAG TPA: high-potential iron-sulfur protein [Xanthobacteraceae bacterium]|nr:high-potential iron-sulfur protein [Xanthobacteraceae bacterium]
MTDVRSRRAIMLQGVACAFGSVALAALVEKAYAAKFPQSSPAVAYQNSPSAKDGHQCDGCSLFQPPSSCQAVDGTVGPTGWCKLWVKKVG